MRNFFKPILMILMVCSVISCVDDYTDANPPVQFDAPTFRISSSANNQVIITTPVNQFQNTYSTYLKYGAPIEFTVSVIDAPGKVASVSAVASVPDFGSVTLDNASVSALVGKEVGEFKFTFTPSAVLPDESDRVLNLVISVTDSQVDEHGESKAKTTTLTVPSNLVSCVSQDLEEGLYHVTEASGNIDGGGAYTLDDLKADGGVDEIVVSITKDRPGLYTMNEVTGGCWPVYYSGRANPELKVDFCNPVIAGHEGSVTAGAAPGPLRKFTIDGTKNGDGTINITWSYERVDAATPANPAKGTYTLEKL
jgi:hypothetical protein